MENLNFIPLIFVVIGAIIGSLAGKKILNNLQFRLGKGLYVGAFPIIGAIIGCFISSPGSFSLSHISLFLVTILLSILGFIRDYFRTPQKVLLPYEILAIIIGVFAGIVYPHSNRTIEVLLSVLWPITIILSLKISAIVYEMPFILASGSGLAFILFFSGQLTVTQGTIIQCYTVLIPAILAILFTASTKKRILFGNSGINAIGALVAGISMIGKSKTLLLFGLLVPSMVIFFPFALISLMIASSYFGNKLHSSTEKSGARFKWTLQREKLVVFSGQIFLCLNFLLILVALSAPTFGYVALFLLLIGSLWSFFRTFASKDFNGEEGTYEQIDILGCSVDALTPSQVVEKLSNYLNSDMDSDLFHIVTADSLAFVRCNKEPDFFNILQNAEMVVPDGAGLIWAADFMGTPLPSRVPGVALVSQICEKAANEDWKVFLIGGKPGVAKMAAEKLLQSYPKLNLAGIQHGYFQTNTKEEENILKNILESKPKVIFVALGVPKQEEFILKLRTSLKNCVAMGVGGSFDVIAGNIPRAPVWMQNFGIEWLFRLYKEPFRFWRILEIPRFVLQILRHKMNQA